MKKNIFINLVKVCIVFLVVGSFLFIFNILDFKKSSNEKFNEEGEIEIQEKIFNFSGMEKYYQVERAIKHEFDERELMYEPRNFSNYNFKKDKKGKTYLFSFSQKIIVFDENMNFYFSFYPKEVSYTSQRFFDIDNDGNIYIGLVDCEGERLIKYGSDGSFKEEIKIGKDNREKLGIVDDIKIIEDKIFQLSERGSRFIARINSENLEKANLEYFPGIPGKSENFYKVNFRRWRDMQIDILNPFEETIDRINIEIENIWNASFLKEDSTGNFYVIVEKREEEEQGEKIVTKELIYKFDKKGEYTIILKDGDCGTFLDLEHKYFINFSPQENEWNIVFCKS